MIKVLMVCHGSILKSPGKASKINGFAKQKGAYYNAVLKDKTIRQLLETLTEIRDFLNELGYLTFGKDFSVVRITGVY